MKVLFQKDYKDLLRQIESAESLANEKQKEVAKKNKELCEKSAEIERLQKTLEKSDKELSFVKEELVKMTEEKNVIDEVASKEIKGLKKKNRAINGSKGGYTAKINKLKKELEEEKAKNKHQNEIIENYKKELQKRIPKKTVMEYAKRIKR